MMYKTHGLTKSKTYKAWQSMLNRCRWKQYAGYHRYGGRGIKVCERWKKFENFLEDVGIIPEGMSIDRIDNNGNYEPKNVRLVTAKEQANNRSNNTLLEINGETKNLSQWATEKGIPVTTLINRIQYGWKPEDCILPSNSTRCKYLTIDGITKCYADWEREVGLKPGIICRRKKWGWSDYECIQPSTRA